MAVIQDMDNFEPALKSYYVPLRVKNMVYRNQTFLGLINKMEKFGGKNLPIPILFANPQGRSSVFVTAQGNKSASEVEDFVLIRKKDYALADIDNETMEASMGDKGAFMRAATTEINGALQVVTRSLGQSLFGSGSGNIGTIASGAGGASFVLSNAADVVNFEVGQTIIFAPDDSSPSRNTGSVPDATTITAVDRSTGTITADTASITSIANGDAVYTEGDRGHAADSGNKLTGLAGWLPGATVPATAFFGVDRSVDARRLGGQYHDGTSQTVEEALIDLATLIAREGGRPDTVIVNHQHYAELIKELGAKVVYTRRDVPGVNIGFDAIKLHCPTGVVDVVADFNCPVGKAYMLQMDTWKLYSLGAAPKILQSDGNRFLRISNKDGVEVRVGYYAQMGCIAPGWNGVADLAA